MSFKCAGAIWVGSHNGWSCGCLRGGGLSCSTEQSWITFFEAGFSYRIMHNACPALWECGVKYTWTNPHRNVSCAGSASPAAAALPFLLISRTVALACWFINAEKGCSLTRALKLCKKNDPVVCPSSEMAQQRVQQRWGVRLGSTSSSGVDQPQPANVCLSFFRVPWGEAEAS